MIDEFPAVLNIDLARDGIDHPHSLKIVDCSVGEAFLFGGNFADGAPVRVEREKMCRIDIDLMGAEELAFGSPLVESAGGHELACVGGIDISCVGVDINAVGHLDLH